MPVRKTILIADDDRRLATALAIRLRAAGYEVLTALDSDCCRAWAGIQKPDLILMDIRLPETSGLELARDLKVDALSDVPVIFMSASQRSAIRDAGGELSRAEFIEKPFDSRELLAKIHNAIGKPDQPPSTDRRACA